MPFSHTTESWIEAARKVHGGKYDYSRSVFVGVKNKITIICPIHGPSEVIAGGHLRGSQCLKCAGKAKLTTAEWVAKAVAVHGNRFDYSRVDYNGNRVKVEIICRKHGPFWQEPLNHVTNKAGCPVCAGFHADPLAVFIAKAKATHGERYDYSQVEYRTTEAPVVIVCREHGEFRQRPYDHLSGHGCKLCAVDYCADLRRKSLDEFIAAAVLVHGNRYDYSQSDYINSVTPIRIICPDHGPFLQNPQGHIAGYGCAACAGKATITRDVFVGRSRAVHGDRYEYKDDFAGYLHPTTIICPDHGPFAQVAKNHANGSGCPACARESTSSAGETEVADWLVSRGMRVERNRRDILGGFEIDIYLPDLKAGIEYHGAYWHCDTRMQHPRIHETKLAAAESAGIRLLTVWDFDWSDNRDLVERYILTQLGVSSAQRYNARSGAVAQVNHADACVLYDRHHIQGSPPRGAIHYGLEIAGELVACMSFGMGIARRGKPDWELARYATGGIVRGGASKLFAAFLREQKPEQVWSFSDRQHFGGELYKALGFVADGRIPADYRVYHQPSGRLWHKSKWQRRHIPARLAEIGSKIVFDPETDPRTEREIQNQAGALRIYDAGKIRWVYSTSSQSPSSAAFSTASRSNSSSTASVSSVPGLAEA